MNNKQAQTGNDILNYLCRFINNKPVPFSKIARDLKLDAREIEANIQAMMNTHPEWYTVHKKKFSGQGLMLNAPMLKEIHKFLVLGGYTSHVAAAAGPAKTKEAKPEEKNTNTRNTVIIKPRLDLNHS